MRNLLHQLGVGIARVSGLNGVKDVTVRYQERTLPTMNEGDLGPRIMDKDGRVRRLKRA